jgi:FMN phosphatase YigB (HAD superfamily)
MLLVAYLLLKDTILGNIQSPPRSSLSSVLVLDIDGTLYDDDCLIESQIRDNCHIFSRTFGYNVQESEDMHNKFGSTIRGICEYGQPKLTFLDYYNDVYPNMDMSLLRKYSIPSANKNTGYNVEMGSALSSLHQFDCPIVVASNSPIFHVNRVLTRLGLSKLKVAAFLTPERRGGLTKNEPAFWDPLFEMYPRNEYICTLIDDNALNVKLVRQLGTRAKIIHEFYYLVNNFL